MEDNWRIPNEARTIKGKQRIDGGPVAHADGSDGGDLLVWPVTDYILASGRSYKITVWKSQSVVRGAGPPSEPTIFFVAHA